VIFIKKGGTVDTFESIQKRRAVKHFDASHRMTAEEVEKILSHAILSPTAFNIQNWRFVVVEDPEIRARIREVSWDQAQVTDSSLFIVLCADLKSWKKEPERYWKGAPQEVQDFLLPALDSYYRGKDQVQRDEAMRSCGIAAQTIMLSAKALGYDSCPMDGFDFDKVGDIINLPEDHVIAMFVAVGKGTKEAWPRPGQLPLEEVVIKNTF
jgi:nitroreductase